VHAVIDDHSRVAYNEIHDDDTALTAVGVLRRAISWFAARGVVVERVLSDNRGCYRPKLWTSTCEELAVTPRYTRPYRPQTNGKIERFTAPWPVSGPSLATTRAKPPPHSNYRDGYTPTITTGNIPRSGDSQRSAA
jgi:transposase InsO family protein